MDAGHSWTECSLTQPHLVNQRCFGLDDFNANNPFKWESSNWGPHSTCGDSTRGNPDVRFMTWFRNVDENDGLPNGPAGTSPPDLTTRTIRQNCIRQEQCICTDDGYNRLNNGVATVKIRAKFATDCALLANTPKCSAYFQFPRTPSPPPSPPPPSPPLPSSPPASPSPASPPSPSDPPPSSPSSAGDDPTFVGADAISYEVRAPPIHLPHTACAPTDARPFNRQAPHSRR